MFKYIGKAVELKYETGFHFKVEYLDEKTLRWTSLIEVEVGEATTGEETYYLYEVEDNVYMLSWIEETGFTVSQILDFNKMEVYAFMSWGNEEFRGGREILDHKGKIKLLV